MSHSDTTDLAEANIANSGFKRALGQIAAPAVISAARIATRLTTRGVHIAWFDDWNATLDQALDALPAIPGCDHDLYRELTQPTSVRKRHALATENGQPTALISLRQRQTYWEPVTYQTLPGVIAPAVSPAALGRALYALGVEVRIEAGLDKSVLDLNPRTHWVPDNYRVDLTINYEAQWTSKNRSNVRRARNRCDEFMRLSIDGEGDLEWCIDQWRHMWANDDAEEVAAAEDRLRFWRAVMNRQDSDYPLQVHTIHLLDGDRRTAGEIVLCRNDTALGQCLVHDSDYNKYAAGKRVLDSAIAWAAAAGFHYFDLGSGGNYKRDWGEPVPGRYGAIFRPRMVSALYRFGLL